MQALAEAAPIVVAGEEHRFLVAEQLRQIGAPTPAIVLEPMGRNTAPAIAAAAMQAMVDGEGWGKEGVVREREVEDVLYAHPQVAEAG